jgi:putative CocE/NonD family hydrolase
MGGAIAGDVGVIFPGTVDQSSIGARQDVLVYTTAPLDQDVEVTGPVTVTLFASSTARDTDFTAKLIDVSPSGHCMNLTDGIIRARYREPKRPAIFIQPEDVNEFTIDLWATSNLFKRGHRIRVDISSSNFPRFDRNTNTGEFIGTDNRFVSVLQTVYHNSDYPSHVVLPIVLAD